MCASLSIYLVFPLHIYIYIVFHIYIYFFFDFLSYINLSKPRILMDCLDTQPPASQFTLNRFMTTRLIAAAIVVNVVVVVVALVFIDICTIYSCLTCFWRVFALATVAAGQSNKILCINHACVNI